jgi:outer membrane protein assembly factor BamB
VAALDRSGALIAYDASNGKHLWTKSIDTYYPRKDMAVSSGAVFALTAYKLNAYNARTGALNWQATVASINSGYTAEQFGGVADGVVVVSGISWVEGVSLTNGHIVWRHNFDAIAPLWPLVSPQAVVIHECVSICETSIESAYDPKTGHLLWSKSAGGGPWPEGPPEWLGSGVLVSWTVSDPGEVWLRDPRTGNTYSTWQSPNTSLKFAAADASRIYIVNIDSSALAIARPPDPEQTATTPKARPSGSATRHTAAKATVGAPYPW